MGENPSSHQYQSQKQAKHVLLDISLFAMEMLDPQRVVTKSDEGIVTLEIPGALATMIEDAKAGNPLLWQFIYAHLKYIQKYFSHALDEKIKKIVDASDNDLAGIASYRLQTLIETFSSKIGGPIGEKREGQINQTAIKPPIARYEPMLDISSEERNKLENSVVSL